MDKRRQLADEGKDDRHDRRQTDDPDGIDAADRHDADIFPIRRIGGGAYRRGDHGGDAVAKQ